MASYEELRKQRERKQVREGSAPYANPQTNTASTGAGSTYERLKLQREVRQNPSYVDIARKYGEYVSSAGDRFAKMSEEANKQYNLVNDAYKRDRIAKVNPEITKITGSPSLTVGGAISVNNAADILEKQREAEHLEKEKAAKTRSDMYASDLAGLDKNSEAYKKGLAEIEKREKFYQVKKDNPNSGLIINKLISPNMYEQQNKNGTEFLTDQERALYAYYLGSGDKEKAAQYLEDIQLNARRRGEILKATEQDARNNPVLSSISSAWYNTGKPIEGAYDLVNRLTGEKLPEANSFMISGDIANRQRDTVREKIDNPVGGFLYDTGMSAVDSLTAALLPGAWGSVALGASAMRDAMEEAEKKGASADQVLLQGLSQGIAEAFFEKISISELKAFKEVPVKSVKDVLKNFLKSTFTNATEEGLTELSNVITDYLIMGSKSDNADATSVGQAVYNSLGRIGLAALGGALMGGPFAAVGSGNAYLNTSMIGKNATSAELNEAISKGIGSDDVDIYRQAAELQERMSVGAPISNAAKGNMIQSARDLDVREQNKVLEAIKDFQRRAAERKETAKVEEVTTENINEATEGTQERTEAFDKETRSFYGSVGQDTLEQLWPRNESKMSKRAYENAFFDSYMQGLNRRTFEATERSSILLPEERKLAYNAGFADRLKKASKGVFAKAGTPGVIESDDAREAFARDEAGFNYADAVAKVFGINVVYDSKAKGNGYFDGSKIVINPNSRISYKSVMNHEFTHLLEDYSGDAYNAYRDFVMDSLYKGDRAAVDAEVNRIINLYADNGVDLDYDAAVREMVADAAENFLNSEQSVNEFVKALTPDERSVVQKIIDFIKDAIEKLKAAIRDTSAETYTGKMLRSDLKSMQEAEKLWIQAAASVKKGETAKSQGKAASISEKTSAENVLDEIPVKKSFSITDPVEQTDDLIAIHNLSASNLMNAIDLGGFAMPSIAIVKAQIGHDKYGDVSVLFDKNTIDPKADKNNKVYGGDAWTPTFPLVEYKLNTKVMKNAMEMIDKYATKDIKKALRYNSVDLYQENLSSTVNGAKGDIVKTFKNWNILKYVFLKQQGIEVKPKQRESSLVTNTNYSNEVIVKIANAIGEEPFKAFKEEGFSYFKDHPELKEEVRKILNEDWKERHKDVALKLAKKDIYTEERFGFSDLDNITNGVLRYFKDGITSESDPDSLNEEVNKAIEGKEEQYEKWLKSTFEGLVEKEGVRNNKDYYTNSGNARTWEQLHAEKTLNNIVNIMREQEDKGTAGFFAHSRLKATATKNFKSIQDIKDNSYMLNKISDEEYQDLMSKQVDMFMDIVNDIRQNTEEFPLEAIDRASNAIEDAVKRGKSLSGIDKVLREYRYLNIKEDTAQKIQNLVKEIAENPTGYFEAKPKRAVGLDEIAKVVAPSNEIELIDRLKENNIPYEVYPEGNEEARKAAVNNTPDIRFSITEEAKETAIKAEQYFGTTSRISEMGYLDVNGKYLDFSGRKQGSGGGGRYVDHRDIASADESLRDDTWSGPMINFMNMGNIRLIPETAGIDLSVKPNENQIAPLRSYIRSVKRSEGYFMLDISALNGDNITTKEYDESTSVDAIMEDINAYFDKGIIPFDENDTQYSITEDSEGNKLSKGQQEYFKDSKVRDDQGRLMKMYHGTPNGTFTVFKGGSYFTNMAWYAERYQSQGASSLSYKKTADDPKTYEAYLNIIKPFDTRDPKVRKIWDDQYYQKWDTGDLADSGLPDWTAAEGLLDFIEENELDFDGLIIDEGGIPGDNGEVISRGFAWVPVNGREQVKSVDNLNPTDDPDIRYSITDLTPEEIDAKIRENKQLERENKRLQKLYANAKKQVKLTKEYKASDAAVKKIAKDFVKEYGSSYSAEDLAETLNQVYSYIYNNKGKGDDLAIDELAGTLSAAVEKVLEESTYMDETDRAVRDALKGITLVVNDDIKRNIPDWRDFRRYEANMFKIRNGETSNIDTVYEELHAQFPWLFDVGENAALEDMLYDLVDTYNAAGPKSVDYGDMKEASVMAAVELLDKYSEGVMEKPTFADKKKTQLKSLKAEQRQALQEAKHELAESYQAVIAEQRKELNKAKRTIKEDYENKLAKKLNEAREDFAAKNKATREEYSKKLSEKILEARDRYKAMRDRDKQRRATRDTKDIIYKKIANLRDKLFTNNEVKHIPAAYVKSVATLLDAIDLNSNNPGTKVAEKLQKYKDMYQQILNSNQGDDYHITLDDDIPQMVQDVINLLDNRPLRNLDLEALNKLKDILTEIETMIGNANKAFFHDKKVALDEAGSATLADLDRKEGKKTFILAQEGLGKTLEEFLTVNNVTPGMLFDRLGGYLNESFKSVRAGEGKYVKNINKAKAYALKKMREYNFNDWYSEKDLKRSAQTFNVGGKSITLDRGQIMSLYVTNQREQGKAHIIQGGITSETQEKKGKFFVQNSTEAVALSESDVKRITDTLTAEQKAFADDMRDYLAKECAKQGNEVTMQLFGIKKFGEDKYFPIGSNKEFIYEKGGVTEDTRLKHSSFTKNLVMGANNPLAMVDFMSVWAQHVDGMAKYNAYTVPLEGMTKLWNYKESLNQDTKDKKEGGQYHMSVRNELTRVYGMAYNTYIRDFINDVNGMRPNERGNELGSQFISLMKKGAVMGNVRVAIQQPSAIVRAFAFINPKYFTNKQTGDYEELAKWNSAAAMKKMGFFDTGMGASVVAELKQSEARNLKEKAKDFLTNEYGTRDEVLSAMAEKADELTWAAIWRACKAETAATTKLKQDSTEFMEHASERFTEIVDKSQVYDSVFEKSDIMRSTSTFAKMVTSFMSEPTKTYSMLWRAATMAKDAGEDKNLQKKAKEFAKKILAAIIGTWLVNDALTAIVDVARNYEDDKKLAEQYIETWLKSFIQEPAGLVPYLKDIASIFEGYEVKRTDMQLFQSLYWAYNKIAKKLRKEPDAITVDDTVGLAGTLSAFFGVPISNIYRDLKTAYQSAERMVKDMTGITEKEKGFESRTNNFIESEQLSTGKIGAVKDYNDLLYESVEEGRLEDLIEYGLQNGRTEDQIFNAINSKFEKQYRNLIAIAAHAKSIGREDSYEEIASYLSRLGYSRAKTVDKAINKIVNKITKEDTEEEETVTDSKTVLDNYYSDTPAKGSKVAASEKYKDIVSAYSENNRSLYAEAVKKAKASGLNTSTVKAQLTTARRKSLADNADFNKLIREAMNGDTNFINTYKKLVKEYPYSLASMDERKDDLAAVALRSELFNSFKAAVVAGDKEGMKKYGLYLRKLTGKELSTLRKLASEE